MSETAAPPSTPAMGAPRVQIEDMDVGPAELAAQLPLTGELRRIIPGPDRPDYALILLDKPLGFILPEDFDAGRFVPDGLVREAADGRRVASIPAIIIAARMVGDQLHEGMQRMPVNLAYIVDSTAGRDEVLDFGKLHYAAVAFATALPRLPLAG